MATTRDYIPKIRESFKELGNKTIEVGVFGGEQLIYMNTGALYR